MCWFKFIENGIGCFIIQNLFNIFHFNGGYIILFSKLNNIRSCFFFYESFTIINSIDLINCDGFICLDSCCKTGCWLGVWNIVIFKELMNFICFKFRINEGAFNFILIFHEYSWPVMSKVCYIVSVHDYFITFFISLLFNSTIH